MLPPDYPEQYNYDRQRGELLIKIDNDQKAFDNAASGQYKQLNFPYKPEYITQINIGKNHKMPLGGKELVGMHTSTTCAMNAAIEYNKNTGLSLDSKYETDIYCKIMKDEKTIYEGLYSKLNVAAIAVTTPPATTPPMGNTMPSETTLPIFSGNTMPSVTTLPVGNTMSYGTTIPVGNTMSYGTTIPVGNTMPMGNTIPVGNTTERFETMMPTTTPYIVHLTGLMLPNDGDSNGYIELADKYPINGYKKLGAWIGVNPKTTTMQNSMLYYESGALKRAAYPKTTFLILKNTYLPFMIKYEVDDEKSIKFYPDTDGAKIPFVLKSRTKTISYTIKTQQNSDKTGNLVYYNFQRETSTLGKCTIYNSTSLPDAEKIIIENSKNYGNQVVELVAAFPLGDKPVNHVGLNKVGVLTIYYVDPAIIPTPVLTSNGVLIEAKNKGKTGFNKEDKYVMVLDDSIKPMKNTKRKFAFPLDTFDRTQLRTNEEWQQVKSHYLESIDNTGQARDGPSMKITMDRPMFSKKYALKIALEKNPEDAQHFLRIYKSVRNKNTFFSIIPDFKMGKLFVADENSTASTMYLVKNENKTTDQMQNGKLVYSVNDYKDYYPPTNYNSKGSDYDVFDKKRDGYCKEVARGKNHFYTIKTNHNKTQCVVPKKSDQEMIFLPKQPQTNIKKSTLYVPNSTVTSGNVKTDEALKIGAYKYLEDAYSTKSYTDFNVSTKMWSPQLSLSEQHTFYNQTNNVERNALGLNSTQISKSVAEVMPIEKFSTITQDTINQINDYTRPKFSNYLEKQTKVNQNVKDISGAIVDINRKFAEMSKTDTKDAKSGVTYNQFYDFSGNEIYSLKEDRTLVPALLKDQQTMAVEHNNLQIISTIAVSTLLISAIFVSSN